MPRALIKAPPTKNTLLSMKKQVRFLEQGHDLLERKRELLTRLVYERLKVYRRQRADAQAALREGYRWLSIAQMRMGGRALHQAALGTKPALDIKIIPRRSLGVEYPAITSERLPLTPVGLMGTDTSFDETRRAMADAVVLLARLGETEMALGRLLEEQRKAQKRVNALKYNIIPRYQNTIRHIHGVLEEEERNGLFQMKVLRERQGN